MKTTNHRMRRGLVLATVVGAVVAPTAAAAPVDPPGVDSGYRSPYSPTSDRTQPASVASDGFDWGDAGIGAASMVALAAIAGGAAIAVGTRQRHAPTGAQRGRSA